MRGYELREFFNFYCRTAKLKTTANAAFLCFRWKTLHFLKRCGGAVTLIWLAFSFAGGVRRRKTNLYRLLRGDLEEQKR
jgi:hypothetical protein